MNTQRVIIAMAVGLTGMVGKPPLTANGKSYEYELDTEIELPEAAVSAAMDSDQFVVTLVDDDDSPAEGESDGTTDAGGGDATGGADSAQDGDAPDRSTTDVTPAQGSGQDETSGSNGKPAGDDDFDPEEAIKGNVPDVEKRIEGMTAEQVKAVRAAEEDREVPRKGVKDALDARDEALKEG